MADPAPIPAPWWHSASALQRYVIDTVLAELAALRPGAARPSASAVGAATLLADDLGADSMELLAVASALTAGLQLHRSGIEDKLLARPTIGEWVDAAHAGLALFSDRLTFHTSGSSGSPKPCDHALAHLQQEAGALAALLPGRRRILSAVPSHHIYGFIWTLLLPGALGLNPSEVLDLRDSSAAALAAVLRPGDLVIGHPAFWSAAVRAGVRFAPDVIGVSSTAPCPDELAEQLSAAGLGTLLQIFGSSETGGIGWRDETRAPFRRFAFWRRSADDSAVLIRHCPGQPDAPFPLQDDFAWTDEGDFLPLARIDHAVQVGGINVFPAKIAQLLAGHPAVAQASVRLMRADEGRRLKAFIVPRRSPTDTGALAIELADWAAQHMAPPERPKSFSFGAQLPTGASGKLSDWIIETA